MVLDAARGIENQTRKLSSRSAAYAILIATFMCHGSGSAGPFDLLDEIEQNRPLMHPQPLGPLAWVGTFSAVTTSCATAFLLTERSKGDTVADGIPCEGLDDPQLDELYLPTQ